MEFWWSFNIFGGAGILVHMNMMVSYDPGETFGVIEVVQDYFELTTMSTCTDPCFGLEDELGCDGTGTGYDVYIMLVEIVMYDTMEKQGLTYEY